MTDAVTERVNDTVQLIPFMCGRATRGEGDAPMTSIAVQRIKEMQAEMPVFSEIARRMEDVQKRAFELFAERGFMPGSDLDDWVRAEREVLGWPAAELKEKDGEYQMDLTLPGFAAKDVEVTATPSQLLVHAVSEKKSSGEEEKVLWSEFGRNEVFRRVALPADIDTDAVTAELTNGLLKVHAPKSQKPQDTSRQVPVQVS